MAPGPSQKKVQGKFYFYQGSFYLSGTENKKVLRLSFREKEWTHNIVYAVFYVYLSNICARELRKNFIFWIGWEIELRNVENLMIY